MLEDFQKALPCEDQYKSFVPGKDSDIYTYDAIYCIERTLLRREPTLSRWKGYHMANTDKWYFAYTFDGETVTVVDACHAQNMHEK